MPSMTLQESVRQVLSGGHSRRGVSHLGHLLQGDTIDLYSVAMHEIGHVLGLDETYSQYIDHEQPGEVVNTFKVDVTRSRPHVGYEIPLVLGPHICGGNTPCPYVDDPNAPPPQIVTVLMTLNPYPGERVLISGVDALLIAQLNLVAKPGAALFWPMWPRSDGVKQPGRPDGDECRGSYGHGSAAVGCLSSNSDD